MTQPQNRRISNLEAKVTKITKDVNKFGKDVDHLEGFITDGMRPAVKTQLFEMVEKDVVNYRVDRNAWFPVAELAPVYTEQFLYLKKDAFHSALLPLGPDAERKMTNLYMNIMKDALGKEPKDCSYVSFA